MLLGLSNCQVSAFQLKASPRYETSKNGKNPKNTKLIIAYAVASAPLFGGGPFFGGEIGATFALASAVILEPV